MWALIVLINFQIPMFVTFDTKEACQARMAQMLREAEYAMSYDPLGSKEVAALCVRADAVFRVKRD